jgi:hypothetical protein
MIRTVQHASVPGLSVLVSIWRIRRNIARHPVQRSLAYFINARGAAAKQHGPSRKLQVTPGKKVAVLVARAWGRYAPRQCV